MVQERNKTIKKLRVIKLENRDHAKWLNALNALMVQERNK